MKIYDDYQSLLADIGGDGVRCLAAIEPLDVDAVCRAAAAHLRLDIQTPELLGQCLIFDDQGVTKKLGRTRLYGLAIPGVDARDCAVAMLARVAERHGPGRVWTLSGMPHYIRDDGMTVAAPLEIAFDGRRVRAEHVVMRFFYGHEAQAVPE